MSSSSLCFRPPFSFSRRRTIRLHRRSLASVKAEAREEGSGAAVVWLKNDLRIDDHLGFVNAAKAGRKIVLPVYVFDRRLLFGFSDEMLEILLFALNDLKKSLNNQGSDIYISFGNAENVISKLVNEVKATHIFVEEEVEYNICKLIDIVESSLSSEAFQWGDPELVLWRTPFYGLKNSDGMPASYDGFRKMKSPLLDPVSAPELPQLNLELTGGSIPTLDELKKYIKGETCDEGENWKSLNGLSAETILNKQGSNSSGVKYFEGNGSEDPLELVNSKWKLKQSVFASENGMQVRGGTDTALNALAAYLRYLEGTARYDYQELHDKLRMAEIRRGASFISLFGTVLYLGIISRRRVRYEATKYERDRNGGFLSPFGYSTATVEAAIETVSSMEWYRLLALKSQRSSETKYPIRIWNWKGYLIQYTVIGDKGLPVLFVHGFGAFLEHFRDNISAMANSGNRVWGITLLGFGRSEKPNVIYTELLWAELLRDFIVDVVREPVHLVGNSIGGYSVAAVAGLWPVLVKSIVLINPAGSVVPNYSSAQLVRPTRTPRNGFAWIGSRLLLLYLQFRARDILTKCYPRNTKRVDDWLISEILRASHDPGVLVVLESVFNFSLQVPINYFFNSFGGKTLVIQGMRDPLSDSKLRVSKIKKHCKDITIKELNAGHCPHDEVPDEVNSILRDWFLMTAETESIELQTSKAT